MHVPDGFLSVVVALALWAVAAAAVGYALKRAGEELGERQVPLMGVLAACIFAGQMLNFAVAGGTSGHLLGAALATILLGPWAAILVLTTVVGIQALIFQDGGLLALGANIANMAVAGVAVAYMVHRSVARLARGRRWGLFAGGFAAAWLSIVAVALGVALQLALSGTAPANLALPAMAGVHALIGVGEGLITVGALAFLYSARRDLIPGAAAPRPGSRAVWAGGLLIALALAVASPLAARQPDGLERVAQELGFLDAARGPSYRLIPDYLVPGIPSEALATILAGVVGTLLVLGVALAAARSRGKRRTDQPAAG
jgi:cobalt/nickel transport system permease protein